ncbi:MAG: glycosyltransferase family 4 protein [Candidatus Ranarchaeia archaeon]
MTKICFIMEGLGVGGGSRNICTLSELTGREGVQSYILSLTGQSKFFWIKSGLPRSKIKVFLAPFEPLSSLSFGFNAMAHRASPLFYPLEFALGTFGLLTFERFDAYIATAWETLYPASVISKLKKATLLYFVQAYEVEFSTQKVTRILANRTYISSAIMFTHSVLIKKILDAIYGHKTYYIGHGLNHNIFHPANSPSFKPQVFTVARMSRDKGFDTFVKAMNYLRRIRTDFNIVIAGEKKALKLEEIDFPYTFKGWIGTDSYLANLYRESIFVNTGRWEALPMPPLEAMACGSAVVMTDMLGAREYTEDRYNCLLAPVDDYRKIAENVNELLSDESLRKDISRNAIETAKRYDWKKVIERFKFMLGEIEVL